MARGLGKGINALFQDMEAKQEEAVQEVSINQCRPNPYQPRKTFHAEAIEELKDSIIQHGILQPLIVRKSIKGYEIVVGERRFRAAKEAGFEKVPVVIRELDDTNMMELALLENLQREDLTPVEEAKAYSNLMKELGMTQEQLAARLGKSRPHIANLVRLLSLPEPVSALINNGELSMGHGRALLGLKNKEQLMPLVEKVRNEELNVRQVEQLIIQMNEKSLQKKKKKKTQKDVFLQERESVLQERLGTGVTIHKGKRKGKIEIEFFTDEDLERILHLFE
ncbi:ParB/RepB/Spo0J family partition protein [Pontibacillus yanchengensis]|uniref:ParB/RepB/Spo0J family partition protein n=2 Tax=Pontibacillus yanchengensis TaxID=462910 RepID=A0A6I5A3M4_9BACI|nr:ParB/RepB/Spo0J family partition protein [Pontibacillus yanchengensis]MYL34441.1 ParB/RepB/Spo0J family partition protein [Pontibacillus yanchengensis]MYL54249.1 ParB/RepB/Spo0J family partition protein [Pontibacillus yanchengensis]